MKRAPISALLALFFAALGAAGAQDAWPPVPPLPPATPDPGRLPPSVEAEPAEGNRWKCRFALIEPNARAVELAESSTQWRRVPAERTGTRGEWIGSRLLDAGAHEYKFIVDGKWIPDPRNSESVDDNHGGRNSVLRLGRAASMTETPAKTGDGMIDTEGFQHRPELPLYFQAIAADRVLIRYRTFTRDVEGVRVVIRGGAAAEMTPVEIGPVFTLWEAELSTGVREDSAARPVSQSRVELEYAFVLTDGSLRGSDPADYTATFRPDAIFTTPEWAKHAVWYQIMVDRFRNGDPDNDPPNTRPWTSEWFTPSPWEEAGGQSFYKYYVFGRFYGGDFQGLNGKLAYLKDLGVNALYLNPVFKADSHHKYDTIDYLHVDDHYGVRGDYEAAAAREKPDDPGTWTWTATDRLFLDFLKKAHALGFKVILDGVFNHVGVNHRCFQDVKRRKRESPFADWFEVTSWEPFRYTGWFGLDSLPVFRKDQQHGIASKAAREHLFAVTRRWMDPDGDGDPSDGIDGWRLDVANEVPPAFWLEWRRRVKSINPDAYISAEIWDRADAWLDGRQFDAVMNYPFARVAVEWILNREKKITPSEADRRLRELRLAYPKAATYVVQNLVDSHDTDRLASMARNPGRAYDQENRVQDNGPNYDNARPSPQEYARARLVALLQMTYVGAPMVYYGDEAGMWGADDPTCRKPMLWKDLEPYEKPGEDFVLDEQLEFYRRAVALRRSHPALRTGSFKTLLADDAADVWVFIRSDASEHVLVALNASNEAREVKVPLPEGVPGTWRVAFGSLVQTPVAGGKLTLLVPGTAGIVLTSGPDRGNGDANGNARVR